jgi:hypothetical protein
MRSQRTHLWDFFIGNFIFISLAGYNNKEIFVFLRVIQDNKKCLLFRRDDG